jgi:hypothetical protein
MLMFALLKTPICGCIDYIWQREAAELIALISGHA